MVQPIPVPCPLTSSIGVTPGEGAGRLVNCYAYKDGPGPRWKPVPGLDDFATVSGVVRGWLANNGFVIGIVGNRVIALDSAGGVNFYEETLGGDGPVTIARNNALVPQVAMVSTTGAYVISGNAIVPYPDADLPVVNSLAFMDGYFLFTTPQGKIIASQLNEEGVDPLSFTTAEAKPDGLLRGVAYGQQYFAAGPDSIEVWQDAAASPFPLTRSTVIPMGIIGPWAIAGQENGWAGPLIYVAQDGSVRRLDGYTPTRISDENIERLIQRVPLKSDLMASVYTYGGNAIWVLSSPTWTIEYNVTTDGWRERESYGLTRWKAQQTLSAFGKWLAADQASGRIYAVNPELRSEAGQPLIWGADMGAVRNFPARIACPAAYFDFVLGQAAVTQAPQVMLSWSHDGGITWANPLTRSLGMIGNARGRVQINRAGLTTTQGVRWRFRVSDPVPTSFAGATMDAAGRR